MAARALVLLGALLAGAPAEAPAIHWVEIGPGGGGEIQIAGLPKDALGHPALLGPEGGRVLRTYVCADPCDAETAASLPNLWGSLRVERDLLIFRPRHTIGPGLTLVARFDGEAFDSLVGGKGTPSLELRRLFDAPREHPPSVTAFFPSGETVPENLLRIYVTFSRPMSLRDVERHVHLSTEAGDEIPLAFVEVPGGLFDPTRTRLTLLVHPGRVKRDIAVGNALGPVMVAGSTVRLWIGPEAQDLDGLTLQKGAERSWRVGPAQRELPDPSRWIVQAPRHPEDSLRVDFPQALDHALASRAITVATDEGALVEGDLRLENGETRLVFTPRAPWRAKGAYRLLIDPILEDPAGNRLGRPFERAVGAAPTEPTRERRFVVGAVS